MPFCLANVATLFTSANVKISPGTSFCPIIGVIPTIAYSWAVVNAA